MANALEQRQILGPIVSAAATALHWLYLWELHFPKAQYMLGDVQLVRNFADGSERRWRFAHNGSCPRVDFMSGVLFAERQFPTVLDQQGQQWNASSLQADTHSNSAN
jgi:hypothetical protein